MSYYRRHMFFCTNQRSSGEECCANSGAADLLDYAKKRIKKLGLNGPGETRVQKSGCLDRCSQGPCAVVYPEGVWYTFVDKEDVDEVVDKHLVGGEPVERLRI